MIKFYFSGAPNPTKVALFLEEAGLAYEPIAVDTRKGQQFSPEFVALNPNSKIGPALRSTQPSPLGQPRPSNGILVALICMNRTLESSGRLAM